eukprot:gnl/Chilomastix_caulleri/5619.p1 GENE.gnl/Chilomastix_caulleri/5619~~gnl/Chilomastix_caulleri/5619.p1  ORF type:complete len:115 (+),score=12.56 gnl/Chilomastix_caulleri/5619:94-438(+)
MYIDWYIFPTVNQSASSQINNTISYLKSNGLLNGNMIWIDVEGPRNISIAAVQAISTSSTKYSTLLQVFIMDVVTIIVLVCILHHLNGIQFAVVTLLSVDINSGGHVMMVQHHL